MMTWEATLARKVALLLGLCLMLSACGAAALAQPPPADTAPTEAATAAPAAEATTPPPAALNPCLHVDTGLIERQAREAEGRPLPGLRALVAPHYAPQLDLLAGVLGALDPQGYDLVVVLGPDHTGEGAGITVSARGWDTPYGILAGSEAAGQALLYSPDIRATENDDLLARDHAVATHMPYLARYMPRAEVAGVLVGRHTGAERLFALAEALAALGESNRLLVLLSVDFSHYQTLPDAEAYDAETVDILERGDMAALLGLGSTHVDSPETLAVFLHLAELWALEPGLEAQSRNTFVENGAPMAGSFMLWSLTAAQ